MRRRMGFRWVACCAASGLFGAGCTAAPGGTEKAEVPTFTVEDSAGVRVVQNHSPVWTEGGGWRVGELQSSIGLAGGSPEHQLYRVFDATRL